MAHREPSEVELEAAHWLVVLDAPRVDRLEVERFQAWLAADPAHKRAYEAVSATSDQIDALLASEPDFAPEQAKASRQPRSWVLPLGALAAALILAFTLSPISPLGLGRGEAIATAVGEARTLQLEDGSRIELSPGARITINLTESERRVRFARGVALFDVAHDANRPFVVETAFGDLRVLGTSFVVRLSDDEARTTVLTGTVRGSQRTLLPPDATATGHAGDEIVLRRDAVAVAALAPDEQDRRLAWRERMVALDGQTLRQAAAEMSRFSGARFEFADEATADMRLGGYVRGDDVDAFLDLLAGNVGVHAERRADGVIVLRRAA